jgi:hypothetical protein
MTTQTLEVIPVEEKINSELVKENITEKVLAGLREKYLPLTINGQDDKEGYLAVSEARKDCKRIRVLAKKICEAGREEAVSIQKAWIAKQNEVIAEISKVEDYLEKQEKEYDAEKDRIAAEKKRKHDDQFVERSVELTKYGASLIEGYFVLGEVKYEASSIREVDAEIWEQNIKPKYKAIFDEAEKIRVENEQKLARVEQMRETIINARLSHLLQANKSVSGKIIYHNETHLTTVDELVNMTESEFGVFKLNHNNIVEEKIQKEKELQDLKDREDVRSKCLYSIGFTFDGTNYVCDTVTIFASTISFSDDDKWDNLLEIAKRQIEVIKEEAKAKQEESRKKAQAEADAIALGTARLRMLTDYSFEGYTDKDLSTMIEAEWEKVLMSARTNYNFKQQQLLSQKQKSDKELSDQKQAEELAKAGDKANWDHFVSLVSSIKIPIMKSGKFRNLAGMATEKLQEIITLNAKP